MVFLRSKRCRELHREAKQVRRVCEVGFVCLKRFFIGFAARNEESMRDYTAKGIKNLWFAVLDMHPGEVVSAKAEKTSMQMRRQPNRQCQAGTGCV